MAERCKINPSDPNNKKQDQLMPHTGAIAPFFQGVAFSQSQLQAYAIEEASQEQSASAVSNCNSQDVVSNANRSLHSIISSSHSSQPNSQASDQGDIQIFSKEQLAIAQIGSAVEKKKKLRLSHQQPDLKEQGQDSIQNMGDQGKVQIDPFTQSAEAVLGNSGDRRIELGSEQSDNKYGLLPQASKSLEVNLQKQKSHFIVQWPQLLDKESNSSPKFSYNCVSDNLGDQIPLGAISNLSQASQNSQQKEMLNVSDILFDEQRKNLLCIEEAQQSQELDRKSEFEKINEEQKNSNEEQKNSESDKKKSDEQQQNANEQEGYSSVDYSSSHRSNEEEKSQKRAESVQLIKRRSENVVSPLQGAHLNFMQQRLSERLVVNQPEPLHQLLPRIAEFDNNNIEPEVEDNDQNLMVGEENLMQEDTGEHYKSGIKVVAQYSTSDIFSASRKKMKKQS